MSEREKVYLVSRHEATKEYFRKLYNGNIEILEHINSIDEIENNSIVIGNLPVSMIDELINRKNCEVYIIGLNIPRELRGKDLSSDELERFIELYQVMEIKVRKVM